MRAESPDALLARARVVLKDVTHPGNIGAAARAMKTMGLSRMFLAAARALPDEQSRALAAGADDVLAAAKITSTLPAAISDCARVFAYTARRRDLSPPCLTPRAAADDAARRLADGGEIALLFGGERSGLSNDDVRRADVVVEIPTSSSYKSLNLAQAVQIAAYELRQSLRLPPPAPRRDLPTHEEFENMMTHWQESLRAIGLPKNSENRMLLPRLRRILARADMERSEIRLMRGICHAIIHPRDD